MIHTGVPVSPLTIIVRKRRWSQIGIMLNGGSTEAPRVSASTDPRFRVDDTVYIINGRYVVGAQRTARDIRRKRSLSITVLRACPPAQTLVESNATESTVLVVTGEERA